jgi:serine/threonine protein kinase
MKTKQPPQKNPNPQKGVVLRDIKLDNLLLHPAPGLPQPLLRICDFGYSRSDARGARCYSKVGLGGALLAGALQLHEPSGFDETFDAILSKRV